MQVYVELAVAENFCMDFTLLYAAKAAVKNRGSIRAVALSSAIGACFAVFMPLIPVPEYAAVIIKIAAGLLMCFIAGRFSGFKGYIKFCAVFFALSALLAGALIALFWLVGADYFEGNGYIVSSIPVGIPLFGALIIFIASKKAAAKFSKGSKRAVGCRIYSGGEYVALNGFFDSGNRVYLRGEPVSVIPSAAAGKLVELAGINDGVKIHTVAGSKFLKVFTADRLEVDLPEGTKSFKNVKIGVSCTRITDAVLHPDILED